MKFKRRKNRNELLKHPVFISVSLSHMTREYCIPFLSTFSRGTDPFWLASHVRLHNRSRIYRMLFIVVVPCFPMLPLYLYSHLFPCFLIYPPVFLRFCHLFPSGLFSPVFLFPHVSPCVSLFSPTCFPIYPPCFPMFCHFLPNFYVFLSFPRFPFFFSCFPMVSYVFPCFPIYPPVFLCFAMYPSVYVLPCFLLRSIVFLCFPMRPPFSPMLSNVFPRFLMFSLAFLYFPMHLPVFLCFQMFYPFFYVLFLCFPMCMFHRLPHRLSKRQSLSTTTVLTFTWTIILNLLMFIMLPCFGLKMELNTVVHNVMLSFTYFSLKGYSFAIAVFEKSKKVYFCYIQ